MQFDPSFFPLEVSHVSAFKLAVCNRRWESKPERHTNSVVCGKIVEVPFGVIDRPMCQEVRQRKNDVAEASFDGEISGVLILSSLEKLR